MGKVQRYKSIYYEGMLQHDFGDFVLDADYRALKRKLAALVEAVGKAPHDMGCSSLQGGPTTKDWGKLSRCDCWKKAAIAAAEEVSCSTSTKHST